MELMKSANILAITLLGSALIPVFGQERSEVFTHATAHLPQLLHFEEKKEEGLSFAGCLQGGLGQ